MPGPRTNAAFYIDSRGGYALVATHLHLHVPQIRQSIAINGEA